MNRLSRTCLALAVAAIMTLAATARPTVGLLLKVRQPDGFWAAVEAGAKEAAAAADVDLVVLGGNDPDNYGTQIKLLNVLVNQKIDALVIMPTNPKELLAALKAQSANGLKIIVAETDLPEGSGLPFVGYDQSQLAATAAKALATMLKSGDEVALFRGSTDQLIVKRDSFIIAKLKELNLSLKIHQDIYATANETGTVAQKAEFMLKKYPNSRMFISSSSMSTAELLAAARTMDNADKIKICGFGANLKPALVQGIESGMLQVYIAQVPKEIGFKSVAAAVDLIRGKKLTAKIDLDTYVVTKDNINDPAIQAIKVD